MTNQERNTKLAELLGYKILGTYVDSICVVVVKPNQKGKSTFNPCEDWNQLMPLVIEHGITLEMINNSWPEWGAMYQESCGPMFILEHDKYNKDPQLALVDCLIAVLEGKKNE